MAPKAVTVFSAGPGQVLGTVGYSGSPMTCTTTLEAVFIETGSVMSANLSDP